MLIQHDEQARLVWTDVDAPYGLKKNISETTFSSIKQNWSVAPVTAFGTSNWVSLESTIDWFDWVSCGDYRYSSSSIGVHRRWCLLPVATISNSTHQTTRRRLSTNESANVIDWYADIPFPHQHLLIITGCYHFRTNIFDEWNSIDWRQMMIGVVRDDLTVATKKLSSHG